MKPESVWDYPRPPTVETSSRVVRIVHGGSCLVDTSNSDHGDVVRVLETSHPPVYYVDRECVAMDRLRPVEMATFCEFKGLASYLALLDDDTPVAWFYPEPGPGYEALAGKLAFYPGRVDSCFLDDVPVVAQTGAFYGGWITPEISGPFKGGPGTAGW